MPAWLLPALKAVLPHVGTILSAAAPVFTKKSGDAVANQTLVLQQQITELQAAASKNDTHIKELAAQIRTTIEALEQGAVLAERRHRRMLVLCSVAIVLSIVSVAVAFVFLQR